MQEHNGLFAMLLPMLNLSVPPPAPLPARWFVLLVRGGGRAPKGSDVGAMQTAHIANFGKRFQEGKLAAAGPLEDPTKHRRGIVVLTVRTRAEVDACFTGDPYIENRMLRIEAHKWISPLNGFGAAPDPEKIAPHRMVRLTFPNGYAGPFPRIPGGVGGRFAGERGGVLLTATTDDAALASSLRASPAVQAGTAFEIVPLWMSAGTITGRS